jgi:hypothetical protein
MRPRGRAFAALPRPVLAAPLLAASGPGERPIPAHVFPLPLRREFILRKA